ncbi:MAG: SDR family oxidoreductase [Melioribacteraceae bacterium]|nr:SDR family oxidoreductase [Melioribacteraceae bacterium]MCF8263072.1 SDR family oxidoreductase [Melioribacteraceae bacterium]MCF8431220.1 SDR family oxidoreductase [Melioribacteraceae bacterium]
MKILMIGGTGIISSAVTKLCLEKGYDVFLLNRGESRKLPDGAKHIKADIRKQNEVKVLLEDHKFDSVVDWISFTREHAENDFELFRNRTKQFIYISSASAYLKPVKSLPVKEDFPLGNPVWEYSRNKIAGESFLTEKRLSEDFPVTIVRPSHTYDKTKIPLPGYWTTLKRMIDGKPIIIHGDGTSLWTLTHTNDFAKGFLALIGNESAIGETYNITSDEYLTWDEICKTMAAAINVIPKIVHVPSDIILKYDREWGEGLLGDKAYSMIFDNTKIKSLAPEFKSEVSFEKGAKEIVMWYLENKERQIVDIEKDKLMDFLAEKFR